MPAFSRTPYPADKFYQFVPIIVTSLLFTPPSRLRSPSLPSRLLQLKLLHLQQWFQILREERKQVLRTTIARFTKSCTLEAHFTLLGINANLQTVSFFVAPAIMEAIWHTPEG